MSYQMTSSDGDEYSPDKIFFACWIPWRMIRVVPICIPCFLSRKPKQCFFVDIVIFAMSVGPVSRLRIIHDHASACAGNDGLQPRMNMLAEWWKCDLM